MRNCQYLFFLCSTTFLIGCLSTPTDTEPPQTLLHIPATADTNYLRSGRVLLFDATFSDNQALSRYQLDISMLTPPSATWDTVINLHLVGDSSRITAQLPIPLAALTGLYRLQTYCQDQTDWVSDSAIAVLNIQNATDTVAPQLAMTEPNNTNITVFGGNNLVVIAELTDDQKLHSYYLQLYKNNTPQPIYQSLPTSLDTVAYLLQEIIPMPAQVGNYYLQIRARDAVNNTATKRIDITVL